MSKIFWNYDNNCWQEEYDEKREILVRKLVCEAMLETDERLNNPYYNIYVWYSFKEGKLYFKLGKADKTINARYNNVTGSDAKYNMILAYHYDGSDVPIHKILQERAKNNIGFIHAPFKDLNTEEAYIIQSSEGFENFIKIVEEVCNQKCNVRKDKPLYGDIKELVEELILLNAKYLNLDLCYRWGKTRTTIELHRRFSERIMILASYVGTVKSSYKEEILTNKSYENIMFIDPDEYRDKSNYELYKICEDWLEKDSSNKIMYYLALTGNMNENEEDTEDLSCFKRRISSLLKLKKYSSNLVVEESDFGAHCEKQGQKIKFLMKHMKCNRFIAETGTAAEKIQKIFKNEKFVVVKRDYLIHVLGSKYRPNVIGISWNVLNNSTLAAITGKEVMENFSDMMKVLPNGHFQEEWWFISCFSWYFLSNKLNLFKNIDRTKARLMDIPFNSDFASIIYTCTGNKIHEAMKNLLESIPGILNAFLIKIIDGNTMSNKEAERIAKNAIKDAASMGKRVIFIASGMANRSFSVPEIKNVLLMMNDASFESISQKIARALTPINGIEGLKCNIIDFRMNYQEPFLAKYLSELGIAKIKGEFDKNNLDEKEIIQILKRHGKIDFLEYDINGINPIRQLNSDELTKMMQSSRNFADVKNESILQLVADEIHNPIHCGIDFNGCHVLENTNVKGDQNKIKKGIKFNKNKKDDKNEDKNENDAVENPYEMKRKHVNFLVKNANYFRSYDPRYEGRSDIIYNYVIEMSDEQKKMYENHFDIDMKTITDIVINWKKHGESFDIYFK